MFESDLNRLREAIIDPDALDYASWVSAAKGAASGLDRDRALAMVRFTYGLDADPAALAPLREAMNAEQEIIPAAASDQLLRTLLAIAAIEALVKVRKQARIIGLGLRCADRAGLTAVHPDLPGEAGQYLRLAADRIRIPSKLPSLSSEPIPPDDATKVVIAARKAVDDYAKRDDERQRLVRWMLLPSEPADPRTLAGELTACIGYSLAPSELAQVVDRRFGRGVNSSADVDYTPPEVPIELRELCPDLLQEPAPDQWVTPDVLAATDQLLLIEAFEGART